MNMKLVGTDPDIYHVIVMLGDRMFDAAGEIDVNYLVRVSQREYRDTNPGFFKDIGMDETAIRELIINDTNWSISTERFYAVLKNK